MMVAGHPDKKARRSVWFSRSQKPGRPGYYETKWGDTPLDGPWLSRWDGRRWCGRWFGPEVFDEKPEFIRLCETGPVDRRWGGVEFWRGLAHQPRANP
jgi:hypothetical protein